MYRDYRVDDAIHFSPPPRQWGEDGDTVLSSMHQLSPYIGKLKPQIARHLVETYTRQGDLVLDPFCGSGSIPLEACLAGRHVFASDVSPYAFLITKAKLNAPTSEADAFRRLAIVSERARARQSSVSQSAPAWVRQFFHPRTLRDAIDFADECIERREYFLLACLLGILHHQRPGFLSYPSSHLVPYLRDKKYPRVAFPEMYEYRDLVPRMEAKISRAYKRIVVRPEVSITVRRSDIRNLRSPHEVNAIITSPPYMNALDYRRDNRLRLWFLDRSTQDYFPEPTDRRKGIEMMVRQLTSLAEKALLSRGKLILIIGETVLRKRIRSHPSAAYAEALEASGSFRIVRAYKDNIPDVRRARRDCEGTKAEHLLIFERV